MNRSQVRRRSYDADMTHVTILRSFEMYFLPNTVQPCLDSSFSGAARDQKSGGKGRGRGEGVGAGKEERSRGGRHGKQDKSYGAPVRNPEGPP